MLWLPELIASGLNSNTDVNLLQSDGTYVVDNDLNSLLTLALQV